MEPFTITVKLTTKEYSKVLYRVLYKKPSYILFTVVGLFMLLMATLEVTGVIESKDPSIFGFGVGLGLLSFPSILIWMSVKQLMANPSVASGIEFTFSEEGFKSRGETFNAEFTWSHILKQKEFGDFIVLYHNKTSGNFIRKSELSLAQLDFIKSKVRNS